MLSRLISSVFPVNVNQFLEANVLTFKQLVYACDV